MQPVRLPFAPPHAQPPKGAASSAEQRQEPEVAAAPVVVTNNTTVKAGNVAVECFKYASNAFGYMWKGAVAAIHPNEQKAREAKRDQLSHLEKYAPNCQAIGLAWLGQSVEGINAQRTAIDNKLAVAKEINSRQS